MAHEIPLGKTTNYPDEYTPSVLFPIARSESRASLVLPACEGYDLWRLYEITFLNRKGLPEVYAGHVKVPASSLYIVESKSLKLYINSLCQTVFESAKQVSALIERDLSELLHCRVSVELFDVTQGSMGIESFTGIQLEKDKSVTENLTCSRYEIDRSLLKTDCDKNVSEKLYTNLFRSLCPVTGQPDYASVRIEYTGRKISRSGLLAYLVSYRKHQGFHENCVERIFADIKQCLSPEHLTVTACFTRRGGIDISPVRSDHADFLMPIRTPRQ